VSFACFPYALGDSEENPCYCTCRDGFAEHDTSSTIDGVTYDSTCEFETACDRHKETLTGGDCGVHAFCDESTGSAQCHCEDGFVNWSDGAGCVRRRVVKFYVSYDLVMRYILYNFNTAEKGRSMCRNNVFYKRQRLF
jgi:hypothetical protein